MSKLSISEIQKLSPEERLKLLEEIWDSLAADPSSVPLSAAQRRELDRRLEEHARHPEAVLDWEEIRDRLRPGT